MLLQRRRRLDRALCDGGLLQRDALVLNVAAFVGSHNEASFLSTYFLSD